MFPGGPQHIGAGFVRNIGVTPLSEWREGTHVRVHLCTVAKNKTQTNECFVATFGTDLFLSKYTDSVDVIA